MFVTFAVTFMPPREVCGQGDGLLTKNGRRLFPIGFYELPADDAKLRTMAESGVNLVRCHSKADLDRAKAAGIMGWLPLNVQSGATDKLRTLVESVADHPALAIWEGPDEIVWNFTAASQLRKSGIHKSPGEWQKQTPQAVEYAEKRAREIMPKMRAGIEFVRRLDKQKRQVWINEALDSDVKYVRQYMDWVDITGCDLYPVRHEARPIARMAAATERWKQVGRGKPVWMVLQAFSWSELGESYGVKIAAYPTFAESRFMAYDVIVHGAKGILYWGSNYLKSDAFRESLYALTSEIAALQPFLVAPEEKSARATVIEAKDATEEAGVRMTARRAAKEWLIILVNEDNQWHMAVEVTGLAKLNGRSLELLYGHENATVERGEFVTRMPPLGVKVFATSRKWETTRRQGRDYGEQGL
jgi:hypothetical protein